MEKKLDGNCTSMLWAVLNKSWRQHPIKQQIYGHLPPISKTIKKTRQARHAGDYWRSRSELISDVPLCTPSHRPERVERPARTYLQQLCTDTVCCLEDLARAMDDRDEWQERAREICVSVTPWWWWWIYIYIHNTAPWNITNSIPTPSVHLDSLSC